MPNQDNDDDDMMEEQFDFSDIENDLSCQKQAYNNDQLNYQKEDLTDSYMNSYGKKQSTKIIEKNIPQQLQKKVSSDVYDDEFDDQYEEEFEEEEVESELGQVEKKQIEVTKTIINTNKQQLNEFNLNQNQIIKEQNTKNSEKNKIPENISQKQSIQADKPPQNFKSLIDNQKSKFNLVNKIEIPKKIQQSQISIDQNNSFVNQQVESYEKEKKSISQTKSKPSSGQKLHHQKSENKFKLLENLNISYSDNSRLSYENKINVIIQSLPQNNDQFSNKILNQELKKLNKTLTYMIEKNEQLLIQIGRKKKEQQVTQEKQNLLNSQEYLNNQKIIHNQEVELKRIQIKLTEFNQISDLDKQNQLQKQLVFKIEQQKKINKQTRLQQQNIGKNIMSYQLDKGEISLKQQKINVTENEYILLKHQNHELETQIEKCDQQIECYSKNLENLTSILIKATQLSEQYRINNPLVSEFSQLQTKVGQATKSIQLNTRKYQLNIVNLQREIEILKSRQIDEVINSFEFSIKQQNEQIQKITKELLQQNTEFSHNINTAREVFLTNGTFFQRDQKSQNKNSDKIETGSIESKPLTSRKKQKQKNLKNPFDIQQKQKEQKNQILVGIKNKSEQDVASQQDLQEQIDDQISESYSERKMPKDGEISKFFNKQNENLIHNSEIKPNQSQNLQISETNKLIKLKDSYYRAKEQDQTSYFAPPKKMDQDSNQEFNQQKSLQQQFKLSPRKEQTEQKTINYNQDQPQINQENTNSQENYQRFYSFSNQVDQYSEINLQNQEKPKLFNFKQKTQESKQTLNLDSNIISQKNLIQQSQLEIQKQQTASFDINNIPSMDEQKNHLQNQQKNVQNKDDFYDIFADDKLKQLQKDNNPTKLDKNDDFFQFLDKKEEKHNNDKNHKDFEINEDKPQVSRRQRLTINQKQQPQVNQTYQENFALKAEQKNDFFDDIF